jgi:hypothetical protein
MQTYIRFVGNSIKMIKKFNKHIIAAEMTINRNEHLNGINFHRSSP